MKALAKKPSEHQITIPSFQPTGMPDVGIPVILRLVCGSYIRSEHLTKQAGNTLTIVLCVEHAGRRQRRQRRRRSMRKVRYMSDEKKTPLKFPALTCINLSNRRVKLLLEMGGTRRDGRRRSMINIWRRDWGGGRWEMWRLRGRSSESREQFLYARNELLECPKHCEASRQEGRKLRRSF